MMMLEAHDLMKVYRGGAEAVAAVRGATLGLETGEMTFLMGPSGSGKTSLLSMLGCILLPDRGTLRVCGRPVVWKEAALPAVRLRYFGFVYQHFNLLSALTVSENVQVPLLLAGRSHRAARPVAERALERVSLSHRSSYRPATLSGGEMQRVAIARAIVTDAPILLADEPTGNLDFENGLNIMSILRSLASETDKSVLVVTHDERYLHLADRVIRMEDGELRVA